jgi:hypothetical protein
MAAAVQGEEGEKLRELSRGATASSLSHEGKGVSHEGKGVLI